MFVRKSFCWIQTCEQLLLVLFSVFTFHYFEREKKKGFILPYLRGVLCNHNLVYPRINSLFCLILKHLRIPFMEHQSLRSQGKMTRS
jgi:hypothetical protein